MVFPLLTLRVASTARCFTYDTCLPCSGCQLASCQICKWLSLEQQPKDWLHRSLVRRWTLRCKLIPLHAVRNNVVIKNHACTGWLWVLLDLLLVQHKRKMWKRVFQENLSYFTETWKSLNPRWTRWMSAAAHRHEPTTLTKATTLEQSWAQQVSTGVPKGALRLADSPRDPGSSSWACKDKQGHVGVLYRSWSNGTPLRCFLDYLTALWDSMENHREMVWHPVWAAFCTLLLSGHPQRAHYSLGAT